MPLVDRGVSQLTREELHDYLGIILAPLEILVILIIAVLYWDLRKHKVYEGFPSNLWKWVVVIDFIYAVLMGPCRWLPGNSFYEDFVDPSTESGCKTAVFFDTFCQMALLFTNTGIVGCIFFTVYFKQSFASDLSSTYTWRMLLGLVSISSFVAIATTLGEVSNYVGWCTANSSSVIFKMLVWFLALVIQVTMIIPTSWIIYESSKKSKKAMSTVLFLRFIGIVFTQIIGLFPIMGVEFLALARKPVPLSMMWCVIVCFPVSHYLDVLFLSMKSWSRYQTNLSIYLGECASKPLCCCMGFFSELIRPHKAGAMGKSRSTKNKKKEAAEKENKKTKKSASFFENVPFWLHLLFTLAIPFVLLSSVSIVMLFDYLDVIDKADLILADIRLTTLISNYIHETQKERGATGVFMGSRGGRFKCEITAQYLVTDVQKRNLEHYLGEDFRNVKLVTKLTFLHSLIYMLNIQDHRSQVQLLDDNQLVKSKGVGWYSDHNMFFVGIVALVCRDSHLDEDTITHYIYANLAFVSAKEKAGVERAKGSVAFAANGWSTEGAYSSFVALVAQQENHMFFFETYVADENLVVYQGTLKERVTVVSNQMREIALDADSAVMALYEGGDWFGNMTGKINLIRAVERVLAGQLTEKALGVVNSTTSAMVIVVCVLALVLIIDGLMILGLARTSDHLKRFQVGQGESAKNHASLNFFQRTFEKIKGISFVVQVLIPVVLCGLGLLIVSWLILKSQVDESQLAASTWENMNLQFFMSNFIHETQKERGATGVYMGSKGGKFTTNLFKQTQLCDTMRAPLFQFIREEYLDFDNLQDNYKMKNWTMRAWQLEETRINVRYMNITSAQGLGFYTTMNKYIIATVSEMAFRGSSTTVEARLLAYLGFMYMKEKAGNERAVGSLGMGQGIWPTRSDWRKFMQLVAIQENAYLYFEQFGTKVTNERFIELSNSKANQVLKPWREGALTNNPDIMEPVEAADWFDYCTVKINEWRVVENMIAVELSSFFDGLNKDTQEFVTFIVVMLAVLFLYTTYIGVKGIRLLLKSNAYNLYQDKLHDEKKRKNKSKRKKRNKQ